VGTTPAGTFTVDKDQALVQLEIHGAYAEGYARALLLQDPSGAGHSTKAAPAEASSGAGGLYLVEPLPTTPGEWRVAAPIVHDPSGAFVVFVREVALKPVAVG